MTYNQIAEKIEGIACERLEHFRDVPDALLLGPEDWDTIKQYSQQFNANSINTQFQSFLFHTTGGPIKMIVKPGIPGGVFIPVELGESEDSAYKNYYVTKLDQELNDIIIDIIEDHI